MKQHLPYVLWLPSWYPNEYDPFLGDFIQRHAHATAPFFPLVVVHFVQAGHKRSIAKSITQVIQTENLEEYIVYLKFTPSGHGFLDRLRYNYMFYSSAKKMLQDLFRQKGYPSGVHVHVPVKAGKLALWIKKRFGIPYILSEHSSAYVPEVSDHFFKRHFFFQRLVRSVFSSAVSVTNVSRYIGKVLQEIFRLPEVHVVPNVVNTDKFCYKASAADTPFTFLHVSTLDANKNPVGILRAFAQVVHAGYNCRLVMVGPVTEHLSKWIKQLGIEQRVRLTGMVPYEEVARKMQQAHAFVLFSRMENFSCVIIEALCCGLPVVAGAVSGVPEAVNEHNGILVEANNEEQLAKALEQMIQQYGRFNRPEIAAAAQARYRYEVVGRQIFNLYRQHFGARL